MSKGDKDSRSPNFKARRAFKAFDKTLEEWCRVENIEFKCNTIVNSSGSPISQTDIIDKFTFSMLKKDNPWQTK